MDATEQRRFLCGKGCGDSPKPGVLKKTFLCAACKNEKHKGHIVWHCSACRHTVCPTCRAKGPVREATPRVVRPDSVGDQDVPGEEMVAKGVCTDKTVQVGKFCLFAFVLCCFVFRCCRLQVWIDVLNEGWPTNEHALMRMCRWVAENDFVSLRQLEYADDPRKWPGASGFEESELNHFCNLIEISKKRQRFCSTAMYVGGSLCLNLLLPRTSGARHISEVSSELREGLVECVAVQRPANVCAAGHGPRKACELLRLEELGMVDRNAWIEKSRLDAILGGLRLSLASFRSGLRCYIAFVGA